MAETESDRATHPGLGLDAQGREDAEKVNATSAGLPQQDEACGALKTVRFQVTVDWRPAERPGGAGGWGPC